MCGRGFFPIFLEKDLLKVDKILGLTFFQARKKRRFSIYCCWILWSMDCLELPFIRLEEAVSWTQRFQTRKIWPKNEVSLWQTNLKANVCKVSSKHEKERYVMKTTSNLEETNRHFCQHFMQRTTQQTFSAINLASQQKTTKLFFSSQVRKQFKLLVIRLLFAKW